MNTRSLGFALVFVAGCAVGGASARFVVPPANAQQAATLPKWEFYCERLSTQEKVMSTANAMGAQGWEMVLFAEAYPLWCFKRQKL